jgi:hypothetical protein
MFQGVVAIETFLLGIFGGDITKCAFSHCGENRVYDWQEVQPLVLFGVVLGVRVLFLIGERALLQRVITYYQHVEVAHVTHSRQKTGPLPLPGDQLGEGEGEGGMVIESSIDFRKEVQEVLGGNTSGTICILIVSVVIQVTYWFSDFKSVIGYYPYGPLEPISDF